MIEIINISNYDNSIKKNKLVFWQWYKSKSLMWSGYIVFVLLVSWIYMKDLLSGSLLDNILLFMVIAVILNAIRELIVPLIIHGRSKTKIKKKFSVSEPYDLTYTLDQDSITYPILDGDEIKDATAKYSSFRSITYSLKNNAILFRKNLKTGAIVVLLDDLDDKKKEELFSMIKLLKKK